MNRTCNGDKFLANGKHYYRCLMDGTITNSTVYDGSTCSICDREIACTDHEEVEILAEVIIKVKLPFKDEYVLNRYRLDI